MPLACHRRAIRLVLIGTSAGGLATVLAAANCRTLPDGSVWIPSTGRAAGFHAASRLSAPAVVLLAEPSGATVRQRPFHCTRGSGLAALRGLTGASHCDFEGPTNKFCQRVCGGSSPEMQSRAREETAAAVVEMLRGSVAAPADSAPGIEH